MPLETPRYIQVGELVKGISEDVLPSEDVLDGRTFSLSLEDGNEMQLSFSGEGCLSWQVTAGPWTGARGEESCRVTRPRDGIVVVDFVASSLRATAVTIVLDLDAGAATTVTGTLPTREQAAPGAFELATRGEELTRVEAVLTRSFIDRPWVGGAHPHRPTGDLVGKRVKYVYSQTEAYEHIYLSERLYTWHCLQGSEQGLADTDRCHYRRIADDLYLFVWREKIVPTLGVVLVDWAAKRSNGRLFGYQGSDFGELSTTSISARATLLNVTSYRPSAASGKAGIEVAR
jgi:MoaF C-terminal domain/MoaF N-terminal domain